MKQIFFGICLFSSLFSLAQTVIVEEKFEEKNVPVTFQYLPNTKKFIVFKGYPIKMTLSFMTTSGFSYDVDGKKATVFENEKLVSPTFSVTENSFKAYDAAKFTMKPSYKFFINNSAQPVSHDALDDLDSNYFGRYDYNNVLCSVTMRWPNMPFNASFNDVYDFGFTNQKQKENIDFEKDDIFLETIDIKSNSRKRFKLDKPNLALLKGDGFAKFDIKPSFTSKLKGNENFDLITKSVSADSKTTILYKTTFDFEGKKIKELALTLNLKGKHFITSDNSGGPKDFNSTMTTPSNPFSIVYVKLGALSINHYFEDRINGDIYVYGIFRDDAEKVDGRGRSPKGFYVFKFDKDGNKLWESINNIEDKDFLDKITDYSKLQINLLEYNKNLLFSVSVNDFTEFSNATTVDKSTGAISKINFIEYNNSTHNLKDREFITNSYVSDIKNKVFSQLTFVGMIANPNVEKYIKSVPSSGNKLYYETVFSDQGIWLVETDNKEYYKVLLFKE
jgi:hypothetical protein